MPMTRSEFDREVVKELLNYKKLETPEEAKLNSKKCILTFKQLLRFIDSYTVPKTSVFSIPMKDKDNLSGSWIMPAAYLDYCESLRAYFGVPRLFNAVMKKTEKNVTIVQTEDFVELRFEGKLLSNGIQRYLLDGEENLWTFSSPLPWFHRMAEKYCAWIDKESKALMIKTIHNSENYSYTVLKRKSESVVDLTAVLYKFDHDHAKYVTDISVNCSLIAKMQA